MPLYPWLMSAGGHLGLSLSAAGMMVSFIFAFLTLVGVWILIGPSWSVRSLSCLALGAVFPGVVYEYALFPISLLSFVTVCFILLLTRRRFALAGLFGAAGVVSYPSGFLLAPIAFWCITVNDRGRTLLAWAGRVVRSAGIPLAGAIAFLVGLQIWVGNWDAFFKVTHTTGSALSNPIGTFIGAITQRPVPFYWGEPNPGYNYFAPKVQNVFVAVVALGLISVTLLRRPISRLDRHLIIYVAITWFIPLCLGPTLSRYRTDILILPAVVLARNLPSLVQIAAIGLSCYLAYGIGILFFQAKII
jgi:hypothetical protein